MLGSCMLRACTNFTSQKYFCVIYSHENKQRCGCIKSDCIVRNIS